MIQSIEWEYSTCRTISELSLDGCDVRPMDRESSEGVDAELVPIGEDAVPLKVQELLEDGPGDQPTVEL